MCSDYFEWEIHIDCARQAHQTLYLFAQPKADSLVQIAATEHGKSEVFCVIDQDDQGQLKATPMIHADDTRPSDISFANQVGIQTDDSESADKPTVPAELRQTIGSHLRLTNLEVSAALTPSMLMQPSLPRHPHPDGPTPMTMNQLLDSQLKLEQAHQQRDISKMLKGVVTNMHCLTKFFREAGLTPYLGHVLSGRLDKDMPKACALAVSPSLQPEEPSGSTFHAA